MKRYLLYLLFGVAALASYQAPITLAIPPAQAPETRAETYDLRPLQTEGTTITEEGIRVQGVQGTLETEPIVSEFDFMAAGVTWSEPLPQDVTPEFSLRVSSDAGETWSDWQPMEVMQDDLPDDRAPMATELHFATGNAAQVRVSVQGAGSDPFVWSGVKVTLIDGSEGPTAVELAALSDDAQATSLGPSIITRAGWGANESYRFDSQGNELWPREYYSLRAMFVHHTATSPTYPDPAASVRSIYYYHAVTLGWGDIGYHYIVDQYGTIYQGRYGTEENGRVVEGGHALGYNRNTMGVSLIGNFVSSGPSIAATDSLKQLLASRASTYGIAAFASVWLDGVGTNNPDRWFDDSVMGHRDSHNPPRTSCPGDVLYARLDEIRQYVADNGAEITDVDLVEPANGSTVEGMFTLRSDATPNVQRVEYYLDGSYIGVATSPPWAINVASASLPAGTFELQARAVTWLGGQDRDEHTVTIAAIPSGSASRGHEVSSSDVTYEIYLPLISIAAPPPLCQEVLLNGHFNGNTGWMMLMGDYAARYSVDFTTTGPRALRVGMAPGDNLNGYSSARTPFTIPANAVSARVTLQYLPKSGSNPGDDGQYIGLLDGTGEYVRSLIPYGQTVNADQFRTISYDLMDFKGQSIYLYAGAKNDGSGGATSLYVDEASVQVCVPQ